MISDSLQKPNVLFEQFDYFIFFEFEIFVYTIEGLHLILKNKIHFKASLVYTFVEPKNYRRVEIKLPLFIWVL